MCLIGRELKVQLPQQTIQTLLRVRRVPAAAAAAAATGSVDAAHLVLQAAHLHMKRCCVMVAT